MYNYNNEKQKLFSEDGQIRFIKVRDNINKLLKEAGSVKMAQALNVVSGDVWSNIACVYRLVELGEIREITNSDVAGQGRVFVRA